MSEVVRLVPHDQIAEPDLETAKANFRKQLASLCVAAEFEDIPRDFIYHHLRMVTARVRKSLTPEGEAELRRQFSEQI